MITPQEIFNELRRSVVGQDAAIREVAVAIVKHLVGHPAGNILMIGGSGSGKTTLIRAVELLLASRADLASHSTVVRINATVLADEREGYGTTILRRLRGAALQQGVSSPGELRSRIERGIVFIDEIDKIRAITGAAPNPRGVIAQEALLTLMENEEVELDGMMLNSSSILFIAAGAFEELYDAVYRRATIGAEGAPLKPVVRVSESGEVREEVSFNLRDHLRLEDLFRYGMTPQFVSRYDSIVVLDDLGEPDLARIFVEPERSIFRLSRDYFRSFGIDLQITRGAIRTIAWEASRQRRVGARALREIYRRVIRGIEFDPSTARRREDGVLLIDEELVRGALKRD